MPKHIKSKLLKTKGKRKILESSQRKIQNNNSNESRYFIRCYGDKNTDRNISLKSSKKKAINPEFHIQ